MSKQMRTGIGRSLGLMGLAGLLTAPAIAQDKEVVIGM